MNRRDILKLAMGAAAAGVLLPEVADGGSGWELNAGNFLHCNWYGGWNAVIGTEWRGDIIAVQYGTTGQGFIRGDRMICHWEKDHWVETGRIWGRSK